MNNEYEIFMVPDDAPQRIEEMGTKLKFWYEDQKLGQCLYKQARENTGEDWSEKAACELCKLLDLPHANYELAIWSENRGVVSEHFDIENTTLIHGNEILFELIPEYPKTRKYRVAKHTVTNITRILKRIRPETPFRKRLPDGIKTPLDVFIGYLLLDAWIGNTDRHHENWGFLFLPGQPGLSGNFYLAPTFDHASSLGREISDKQRKNRLTTQDKGYSINSYIEKCDSALYDKEEDQKPLTTLDAFSLAASCSPNGAKAWIEQLNKISTEQIKDVFQQFPDGWITEPTIEFALKILKVNRTRLLSLQGQLK